MTEKVTEQTPVEQDIIVEPADNELDTQTQTEGRYRDPETGKFAKRPEETTENPYTLHRMTDNREKIAEKFAEARKAAEAEAERGEEQEPTARIRTEEEKAAEEAEDKPGEEIAPATEAAPGGSGAAPAPAPAGPVPLSIVVDGQMYQVDRNDPRWCAPGMTDEMVRASAQMHWAAQARLQKANQYLDTHRGAPADQSGAPQPANPAPGETKFDADKIGEIVDRIQLGNRDEASEALKELVGLVQSHHAPQSNLQEEVRQALVQTENQREIERAIGKFEQENPDLITDKYLSQTILNVAVDTMIEDMKGVGVTDQMLAPIIGKPEMVAGIYRNMRVDGRFPLKTYDEVLATATDRVRGLYNRPRPQNPAQTHNQAAQQRLEQKRQMQQQPRSAGVREAQGQGPRPQTSAEVVRGMRRARMPWLSH